MDYSFFLFLFFYCCLYQKKLFACCCFFLIKDGGRGGFHAGQTPASSKYTYHSSIVISLVLSLRLLMAEATGSPVL